MQEASKDILLRALQREKKARKTAEQTLEKKSFELYLANQKLREINSNLEATVEKRSEQLKENELRFEKMVESASDLIYRGNYLGLCVYANSTTIQKMGYSIPELKKMHFTALVRDDKLREVTNFYLTQLKEKRAETYLEFPAQTKSGETIWLGQNVIFTFDENGRFEGISAVARDITKQKESLKAIQRSEEKYRNIISNMNLGLLEVDMDEHILQTNQSFCEMIGYSEDELLGKVASEIILKGENRNFMAEKNASRKNGISDAYEMKVKDKSGNLKWWLISGGPLFNDKGEQTGSLGIHLDITDQKKLEVELKEAKNQAELSSRAKEIFLANMSHEIRTPMNGILGMARQLEKSELNKDQKFYLKTITSAADHLMVILNDILDLSKIESGHLEIENTNFSILEVIDRTKNILFAKAEEKGLAFFTKLDPAISASCFGDPTRLNQILINLTGNAVKFTSEGSVSIHCNVLHSNEKNQRVEFSIQDTGIGMSNDYIEKIYDKFSQEDKSIARKFGGTGLGMSISKQLVELMGGKLKIESKKNQGTNITFALNFGIANNELKEESKIYQFDPGEIHERVKGKKILLAEDNEMNQLVVSTSLDYIGLNYDIANNGLEAIEAMKKNEYDLILMDINMPKMDGIDATKNIRESINTEIPIIALTANAMEGANKKYLSAGMSDYLAKPFAEEELFEMLCKWIGGNSKTETTKLGTEMTTNQLYNLEKLQKISRGNQAFIDKMLNLFITRIPEALNEINQAYQASDLETVYKTAHRIKPTLNDLDITRSKDQIIQIEKLAQANKDSEELSQLIDEVTTNVLNVVVAIKERLKINK
ncbi:MAG: PAS domain S-box protein [Salibacteraceae bacterium]